MRKIYCTTIIIILFLVTFQTLAQISTVLAEDIHNGELNIRNKVEFFLDTNNRDFTLKEIRNKNFQPFNNFANHKWQFKNTIWFRFKISNLKSNDSPKVIFYCGLSDSLRCYQSDNGNEFRTTIFGRFSDKKVRYNGVEITLPQKGYSEFFIKKVFYINDNFSSTAILYSLEKFKLKESEKTMDKKEVLTFIVFCLGITIFLFVTSIIYLITSQKKLFFWWSIYLLCLVLYFIRFFENLSSIKLISLYWHSFFVTSIPILDFFILASYMLFILFFLEVKKYIPTVFIIFKNIAVSYLVIGTFFVFVLIYYPFLFLGNLPYIFNFKYLNFLILLIFCILIFWHKIPLYKWILLGSLFLLLGGFLTTVFNRINSLNFSGFWQTPSIYFGFGVLIELLIYTFALSKKSASIEMDWQNSEVKYAKKLKLQLEEQISIVRFQNQEIEKQKIMKITTEFEQKIAETEISALRSQMNPHFIFNCLNSIKLYSLENDSESASEYLTKFSKLIRLVLENSRSERLTLEKELETLRLYIEMEIMRFKEKVAYEMVISPDIDQQYVEIPPLLIQPFVENAIWHGLMHKEKGGKVSILVNMLEESLLEIQIIDNGVGREKSTEYKSKTATKHKSFGLKVTDERIVLINQIYKTKAKVEIIDLFDEKQIGCGTKVIIDIPI